MVKSSLGPGEMAQMLKGLSAKPDDLSLIPKIHMVKGGANPHKLSSDLHSCPMAHTRNLKHSKSRPREVTQPPQDQSCNLVVDNFFHPIKITQFLPCTQTIKHLPKTGSLRELDQINQREEAD